MDLNDQDAAVRPASGGAQTVASAGPLTPTWIEADRLQALHRYAVLDSAPEAAFDDIARVAAQVCRAPMAAVSLVDEARQWFKAEVGLGRSETPRDVSFCSHAIRHGDMLVVPDARLDPLFQQNPLVVGKPFIRFYAGAVLETPDGYPLGALCVLDTTPRPGGLDPDQAMVLAALARQVVTQLELCRAVRAEQRSAERFRLLVEGREEEQADLRASERRLHLALEAGLVGAWEWDIGDRRVRGDAQIARMLSVDPRRMAEGIANDEYVAAMHPDDRAWVVQAIETATEALGEFVEEYRVASAEGVRWLLARGRTEAGPDGRRARCTGVAIDITERKSREDALKEANAGRELAMQAARLGRWDHNPSQGVYYWDPRCREMLGLAADSQHSFDALLALIHVEDRARVAAALARATSPERIGAYAEEYRILRPDSGEVRWLSALGRSTFEDGRCVRFVGVIQDITERKRAEVHQRLLTNELNHRVKNTLATVQAMVSQTLRSAPSPEAARAAVTERLIALGRAHDILTRTSWSAAPIEEVVAAAVGALGVADGRVTAQGPPRRLAPRAALSLAMALHELGTNAVKYGALSNDLGRVDIVWAVEGPFTARRFHLRWSEHGGPPVAPPTRQGFGSRLIQAALAGELRGHAALDFQPTGVNWTLDAPLQAVEAVDPTPDPAV